MQSQRPFTSRPRSRRALLGAPTSQGLTTSSRTAAGPSAPAPGPEIRVDLDVVLAHRATQGFTRRTLREIQFLGRDAWLDRQLDPQSIADPAVDSFAADFPSVSMSIPDLHANFWTSTLVPCEHLQQVCVARSVLSERQLLERVVEFWHDHFNVDQLETHRGRLFFTSYDRDVIRPNALGTFEDLLVAVAKSPAMSAYLDGDVNVAGAPNENFGREVMELHTLGVDGPYTEDDVKEISRCFTGWRYARWGEPNPGDFIFDAGLHDFGPKSVLGFQLPGGGGVQDGLDILHELSVHPKTLDYVSRKLVSWLSGLEPPQAAVDAVIAVWQATGGDLKEIVRAALSDEVLLLCEAPVRRKLKRPYHFGVGLMRQLGTRTTDRFLGASRIFDLVGHRPYIWTTPDGYPDTILAWGSDVSGRWSYATNLLDGGLPGVSVPSAALNTLRAGVPNRALAHRLALEMAGGLIPEAEVARVQQYIDTRVHSDQVVRDAVALLAACPGYQFY